MGREVLVEASRRYRIPEDRLSDIVEKGPHWWERLLEDVRPYRIALQAALCELGRESRLVYHGHLGHEAIAGYFTCVEGAVKCADRIPRRQVRTRQGFTDASARKYIEELDKARSRRLMEMFGSDWRIEVAMMWF